MSKKILFHSNSSRAYTGFGKNLKNVLLYFYNNTDYEIIELAAGMLKNHPDLKKQPWKAYGTLPEDQNIINQLNKDPGLARAASYGSMMLDEIIREEKPDVYIGIEDFWAFTACNVFDKPWWNKIHCVVWTTLDSLPLLPDSIKHAPNIKNYYVWSSFAERALHQDGHTHVKTLHGALDIKNFFRLTNLERSRLRKENNIPEHAFVGGFVFRNQLRKSVPNLLEGFQLFRKENPLVNAYLLLHTNWSEGWDIPRLIKEFDIPNEKILTTYICKECHKYEVKPFTGHDLPCPHCKAEKSQVTTNVNTGINEDQLNEIYNLMDIYIHPITSGGQELPIQEAKMAELITCVTNYSCGEEGCSPESGGLPLEWIEYREPGTQFIKSTTLPSSIAKQMKKVYNMKPSTKRDFEQKSRQYVLDNYSVDKICKDLIKDIEKFPKIDYDFNFETALKNPDYQPNMMEEDDVIWLKDLYKNILNMEVQDDDSGLLFWREKLAQL